MNRTQKTMRNSITGLAGQIITILLSIIARKVFIQYIGVELLGLNSTFASILSTLSLAELGFQQVIVFHLYGALAKGDQKQVNSIVNVYKVVYRCIGCFFIVASLCCVPFLQVFLSDIEATPSVRLYFLIQALSGACTYFLAYKRNILYADQQSYVSALIDTVITTSATLICIVVVMFTPLITRFFRNMSEIYKIITAFVLMMISYVIFELFKGFIPVYYLLMLIFTWGEIFNTLAADPYLTRRVPADFRGRIFGIANISASIFVCIGQLLTGVLYDNAGSTITWFIMIGLCLGGIFLGFYINRKDREFFHL